MLKNNKHRLLEERIEIHQVPLENGQDWVVLKGAERARIGKYYHETAKADVYVVFQAECEGWACEEALGEGVLVPDLTAEFRGVKFYFEIDLGNAEPRRLFDKVERYVQLAGSGEKVIFLLGDGKYRSGMIGPELRDYCQERKLGNFVTISLLENFLKYPLGDVLISPKDGRISITQLVG